MKQPITLNRHRASTNYNNNKSSLSITILMLSIKSCLYYKNPMFEPGKVVINNKTVFVFKTTFVVDNKHSTLIVDNSFYQFSTIMPSSVFSGLACVHFHRQLGRNTSNQTLVQKAYSPFLPSVCVERLYLPQTVVEWTKLPTTFPLVC